jgi:hypothetical protein
VKKAQHQENITLAALFFVERSFSGQLLKKDDSGHYLTPGSLQEEVLPAVTKL